MASVAVTAHPIDAWLHAPGTDRSLRVCSTYRREVHVQGYDGSIYLGSGVGATLLDACDDLIAELSERGAA